ncbi:outer membrane protein [Brevundimonas balnearis]|uniref:Outer membrane protein n=1 Tax=Brevundimonas balnearis TaxID=1572858 RepID=A0ABV6R242_9CAUL
MKTAVSFAALAAAGLIASQAQAQSAPTDWSGPYVSIYGGGLLPEDDEDERLVFDRDFDGDFDDTVVTGAGADAFSPGSCGGQALGATPAAGCDDDGEGVEAGVRVGWDWAFGPIVVGALAEYGVADAEDTVTSYSTTPAFYSSTRTLQRLGAVRARAGYAFGQNLLYATGGLAQAEITNTFFTSNRANSFTPTVNDDEADGWQAGVGWERQLGRGLSFGAEYLYTSLEAGEYDIRVGPGTAPATNPFILPPNTAGTDLRRSNPDFEMHQVRVSMGYRF